MSKSEKVTVSSKDIQQIFNTYGANIDLETAEKILSFLVEFANISLDQMFPDDS